MTDGKGCECFARCEADCVCDADWTPEEVIRLRADIERHIAIASEHATECERLRAKLAEANDYINRMRDILTAAHPCTDPSRDACGCILCELVSRERQRAALAAKEG